MAAPLALAVATFFFGVMAAGGRRRTNGTRYGAATPPPPGPGPGVAPAGYMPPPPPPPPPSPIAMATSTIAAQPAMQTPTMSPQVPVIASTQIPATASPAADPLAHWAGPAVASIPLAGPMSPQVSIPLEPPPAAPVPVPQAVPASPTSQSTAQILAQYINSGGCDRTSIANYQRALGITADGIAGPQTFAAIVQHGGGAISPARQFSAYVNSGGRNTTTIATYQRAIGATADGIVGPNTAAMVAQQGGGVIVQTISHSTATPIPIPSQQPAPQLQTASYQAPVSHPTSTPQMLAALALADYYNRGGRDVATIRGWQSTMGGLTADGIVGANTVARASALGATVNWSPPSTYYPTQAAAVQDAQRTAASALANYWNGGGRDHTAIRSWQQGMTGITADGIMGSNTVRRAAALGATIHY